VWLLRRCSTGWGILSNHQMSHGFDPAKPVIDTCEQTKLPPSKNCAMQIKVRCAAAIEGARARTAFGNAKGLTLESL